MKWYFINVVVREGKDHLFHRLLQAYCVVSKKTMCSSLFLFIHIFQVPRIPSGLSVC